MICEFDCCEVNYETVRLMLSRNDMFETCLIQLFKPEFGAYHIGAIAT